MFIQITRYLIFTLLIFIAKPAVVHASEGDYVVVLHGLFKTNRSMEKVEEILIEHNYKVLNLDYESRKAPIELIVEQKLEPEINAFYQDTSKQIHFVTHSLGGIIVREYLQRNPGINTGRIVML